MYLDSEMQYSRKPINIEAKRQAELQSLRSEAEALMRSGAKVTINENDMTLFYEHGPGCKPSILKVRVQEPDMPQPPAQETGMRIVRDQLFQPPQPPTPLKQLKAAAEEYRRLGIKHQVCEEALTLRVGFQVFLFEGRNENNR